MPSRRDRRIVDDMGSQSRHEIGLQVLRGASVQTLPWAIAPAHLTAWLLLAAATQVLLGSDLVVAAGPRLRMLAVAALQAGAMSQGVDLADLVQGASSLLQQAAASALVFGLVWLLRRLRSCPAGSGSR
jgi:hypothetical protein